MANPTSANATLLVSEDGIYTFSQSDFVFNDADGDSLFRIVASSPVNGVFISSGVSNATSGAAIGGNFSTLQFQPTSDINGAGAASFTFQIEDSSSAVSVSYTASLNIAPVNDAPTLDSSKSPTITLVQNTAAPTNGSTAGSVAVSTLVDSISPAGQVDNISDVDEATTGAQFGIAIHTRDNTNGTWFFSTNGGTSWTAIPAVSTASALPLNGSALLYFQSNAGYSGTSDPLEFYAWDTTTGTNGVPLDASVRSGTTAFSLDTDTISLTITGGNTAPVLDATKSPVLTAVLEDAAAPTGAVGTLVSALVDFATPAGGVDNVTDPDGGALLGVAVTGAQTANGTWYYSINGGTSWTNLGTPSDGAARLLDPAARLYFHPNANYSGSATVTFRAWDQTSGVNGGSADVATNGAATAFSTVSDTASVSVTAVNDAPVNSVPGTALVNMNGVVALGLSVSDVDAGASNISTTLSVTHGVVTVATGGAATILNNGTASLSITGTVAQVNAALTGAVFNPTSGYVGGAVLTVVTDDGGFTGSGGARTDTDTMAITVAAPPPSEEPPPIPPTVAPTPTATAGNDSMRGGLGTDSLDGGAGDDTISGGEGGDNLRGLDDDDQIDGGPGDDTVNGNKGDDSVGGGEGTDYVFGGQGNDTVDGGAGDDPHVNGNVGDDIVHGGDGNDTVYGGRGDDTVYGDAGDDRISGDLGNDILYGGNGADKFVIAFGGGQDWIGDWNPAEGDRILLPRGAVYTIFTYQGQTVLELGDGTTIGLTGVSTFDAGWIVFA